MFISVTISKCKIIRVNCRFRSFFFDLVTIYYRMKNSSKKNTQEIKMIKKYLKKWKKKGRKKYKTISNEIQSKKFNKKPQMRVDTLENGVRPKNTKIEIGKGKDKRTIDISQYIIK